MIRSVTRWCVLGLTVCYMNDAAFAQVLPRHMLTPVSNRATEAAAGELHGVVCDASGEPLKGAVVSAHGHRLEFQVSDRHGRFSFRALPPGTYLVRVHLDGYLTPRGRYVQVDAGARHSWRFAMAPAPTADEPAVLEAGVGLPAPAAAPDDHQDRDESEIAWRLRGLKRGVLREAEAPLALGGPTSVDSLLGRAAGSPARLAAALFDDLSLNGQINLLTITSFNRPEDLFSMDSPIRRPVAYMSLVAPAGDGEWAFRGAVTQGELSSWILAASYARDESAGHQYQAGFSYSTQQYQGGNVEALAAMSEGSRRVGELYASDIWTITPQWTVAVGGRYASYGYLDDRDLLSGRLTLEFKPSREDPLRFRVSAAHREIAPGAEEFLPPAAGPWLPPERTFSELSRGALTPERINHVEVAGEREMIDGVVVSVRAFRQEVNDQLATVFGATEAPLDLGHYYVSTAGDFENYGWGVGVTRPVGIVRASVDYTQVEAFPRGTIPYEQLFLDLAPALLRKAERIHDLTASMNTRVPQTATRLLLVYKLNNAFSAETDAATAARFEVQVNQEMPFLNFTGARWEMLAAVRNLYRADLFDGSIYDELLVVRPPKRVMGGVTVSF